MKFIIALIAASLLTMSGVANAYIASCALWRLVPLVPINQKLEVRGYIEAGPTEWPFLVDYRVWAKKFVPGAWNEGSKSVWVPTIENATTFKHSPWLNLGIPCADVYEWAAMMDLGYFGPDQLDVTGAQSGPWNFQYACMY